MATGDELFRKAEGKINRFLFNDYEGAQELFCNAGAMFKASREWNRAGDSYMRAGDLSMKLKDPAGACSAYTECANAFKKVDMSRAVVAIEQAVTLNIQNNRLGAAARLLKDWAETLVTEGRLADAIAPLQKAQRYFEAEDQASSINQCIALRGKIFAELKKWNEATTEFESLARSYLSGPLKHQAREQFFIALMCRAALVTRDNSTETMASCRESLDLYCGLDIYLPRSRELEVMEQLLDAVEQSDEAIFGEVLAKMQDLRMMNDIKSGIIARISENIGSTD